MDLSPKPPRWLCAEPLEGRWLLSAAAATELTNAPSSSLLAADETVEEEEGADGDVEIDPSLLPAAVLAAFQAQFPGARIELAEIENEDGETLYDVEAEHDEAEVDVSIRPDGTITEYETFLDLEELPQNLREWFQSNRPGAVIEEAAVVTAPGEDQKYEVLYNRPGSGPVEIVLELSPPATTPEPADDDGEDVAAVPIVEPSDPDTTFARNASIEPFTDAADSAATEHRAVARAERTTASAGAEAGEDDHEAIEAARAAAEAAATTIPSLLDERVTRALEALAAGTGATVWLPDVAGALASGLPIDIAAIERELQEVLDELGALTVKASVAASDSPVTVGATRLAAAVALVAAVKLLTHHARKPAGDSPVVFGPGSSTWGWVLGSSTTTANRQRRRRITLLRQHDDHSR